MFDAAAGDDGSPDRGDVLRTVRGYVNGGSVDGVAVDCQDVLALVRYYVRQ